MDSDSNSIHELLELFKHFKTNSSEGKRDLSSISFSDKNYDSHRNPMDSITTIGNYQSRSMVSNSQNSIFEKLYQQSKEKEIRKCRLEYETKKSKEDKERSECTFSPNIHSRNRIRTEYDSVDKNQSFYIKNMQWLERKDRSIKKMQCEKNQDNVNELTFTPRINKKFRKKENKENTEYVSVAQNKGVDDFLSRQQKAQKMKEYVKERQKNPYSHIWNVKKGHFSYVK